MLHGGLETRPYELLRCVLARLVRCVQPRKERTATWRNVRRKDRKAADRGGREPEEEADDKTGPRGDVRRVCTTDLWVVWIATGTFARGFEEIRGEDGTCWGRIWRGRMGLLVDLARVVNLHVASEFI